MSSDMEAVEALFDRLDAYHREKLPWLFQQPIGTPRGREFLESVLADDRATIFVAVTDRLAGFVHLRLSESPAFPIFVPQTRALIDSIFVLESSRRQGIGTGLLRAAADWANDHGASGMDANVYEFNQDAQELFSSMRFLTLSRRMVMHFSKQ